MLPSPEPDPCWPEHVQRAFLEGKTVVRHMCDFKAIHGWCNRAICFYCSLPIEVKDEREKP